MSLRIFRFADLQPGQIQELERAMAAFYRIPPPSYYRQADQAAQQYTPASQPFHCDLMGRVTPGATVLEAGCGTAHLCPHVEKNGGHYTGIDHSESLLEDNRRRFPHAQFFQIGTPLATTFDIVASLYTLEHVANPPAYLESLWRYCRPGGLIGIICPEFIDGPDTAPSIFFGTTPRRFREKIRTFNLIDAAGHLIDLKIRAVRWKKIAQSDPSGSFWINLQPGVLAGADYSIDADAIHLTRLKDIIGFFKQKGAEIVQTSAQMPGVAPEVLRFNCYGLFRKPGGS
jgi:SAM-dependent methyltransferase